MDNEPLITHSFISPAGLVSNYLTSFPGGGLFLVEKTDVRMWDRFRLRFNLPGEDLTIESLVEVLWLNELPTDRPRGVGVRFVELEPDDRGQLDDYLRNWGRRDDLLGGRLTRIFPMDETNEPDGETRE